MAWLARATDSSEKENVDLTSILNDDRSNSTIPADAASRIDASANVRRTADGWEIKCAVDTSKRCQSLRTDLPGGYSGSFADTVLRRVGTDNTAAFAAVCFEQMIQREQEL